jgi:hypothetical protein
MTPPETVERVLVLKGSRSVREPGPPGRDDGDPKAAVVSGWR